MSRYDAKDARDSSATTLSNGMSWSELDSATAAFLNDPTSQTETERFERAFHECSADLASLPTTPRPPSSLGKRNAQAAFTGEQSSEVQAAKARVREDLGATDAYVDALFAATPRMEGRWTRSNAAESGEEEKVREQDALKQRSAYISRLSWFSSGLNLFLVHNPPPQHVAAPPQQQFAQQPQQQQQQQQQQQLQQQQQQADTKSHHTVSGMILDALVTHYVERDALLQVVMILVKTTWAASTSALPQEALEVVSKAVERLVSRNIIQNLLRRIQETNEEIRALVSATSKRRDSVGLELHAAAGLTERRVLCEILYFLVNSFEVVAQDMKDMIQLVIGLSNDASSRLPASTTPSRTLSSISSSVMSAPTSRAAEIILRDRARSVETLYLCLLSAISGLCGNEKSKRKRESQLLSEEGLMLGRLCDDQEFCSSYGESIRDLASSDGYQHSGVIGVLLLAWALFERACTLNLYSYTNVLSTNPPPQSVFESAQSLEDMTQAFSKRALVFMRCLLRSSEMTGDALRKSLVETLDSFVSQVCTVLLVASNLSPEEARERESEEKLEESTSNRNLLADQGNEWFVSQTGKQRFGQSTATTSNHFQQQQHQRLEDATSSKFRLQPHMMENLRISASASNNNEVRSTPFQSQQDSARRAMDSRRKFSMSSQTSSADMLLQPRRPSAFSVDPSTPMGMEAAFHEIDEVNDEAFFAQRVGRVSLADTLPYRSTWILPAGVTSSPGGAATERDSFEDFTMLLAALERLSLSPETEEMTTIKLEYLKDALNRLVRYAFQTTPKSTPSVTLDDQAEDETSSPLRAILILCGSLASRGEESASLVFNLLQSAGRLVMDLRYTFQPSGSNHPQDDAKRQARASAILKARPWVQVLAALAGDQSSVPQQHSVLMEAFYDKRHALKDLLEVIQTLTSCAKGSLFVQEELHRLGFNHSSACALLISNWTYQFQQSFASGGSQSSLANRDASHSGVAHKSRHSTRLLRLKAETLRLMSVLAYTNTRATSEFYAALTHFPLKSRSTEATSVNDVVVDLYERECVSQTYPIAMAVLELLAKDFRHSFVSRDEAFASSEWMLTQRRSLVVDYCSKDVLGRHHQRTYRYASEKPRVVALALDVLYASAHELRDDDSIQVCTAFVSSTLLKASLKSISETQAQDEKKRVDWIVGTMSAKRLVTSSLLRSGADTSNHQSSFGLIRVVEDTEPQTRDEEAKRQPLYLHSDLGHALSLTSWAVNTTRANLDEAEIWDAGDLGAKWRIACVLLCLKLVYIAASRTSFDTVAAIETFAKAARLNISRLSTSGLRVLHKVAWRSNEPTCVNFALDEKFVLKCLSTESFDPDDDDVLEPGYRTTTPGGEAEVVALPISAVTPITKVDDLDDALATKADEFQQLLGTAATATTEQQNSPSFVLLSLMLLGKPRHLLESAPVITKLAHMTDAPIAMRLLYEASRGGNRTVLSVLRKLGYWQNALDTFLDPASPRAPNVAIQFGYWTIRGCALLRDAASVGQLNVEDQLVELAATLSLQSTWSAMDLYTSIYIKCVRVYKSSLLLDAYAQFLSSAVLAGGGAAVGPVALAGEARSIVVTLMQDACRTLLLPAMESLFPSLAKFLLTLAKGTSSAVLAMNPGETHELFALLADACVHASHSSTVDVFACVASALLTCSLRLRRQAHERAVLSALQSRKRCESILHACVEVSMNQHRSVYKTSCLALVCCLLPLLTEEEAAHFLQKARQSGVASYWISSATPAEYPTVTETLAAMARLDNPGAPVVGESDWSAQADLRDDASAFEASLRLLVTCAAGQPQPQSGAALLRFCVAHKRSVLLRLTTAPVVSRGNVWILFGLARAASGFSHRGALIQANPDVAEMSEAVHECLRLAFASAFAGDRVHEQTLVARLVLTGLTYVHRLQDAGLALAATGPTLARLVEDVARRIAAAPKAEDGRFLAQVWSPVLEAGLLALLKELNLRPSKEMVRQLVPNAFTLAAGAPPPPASTFEQLLARSEYAGTLEGSKKLRDELASMRFGQSVSV